MTTPTLTCEHCESEIDVFMDPHCVVYDPSGATGVICADCRAKIAEHERLREAYRIKRGWRA
jgi:hypothetical protein